MIPIGVMSIPQFILLFIFPLLGAISIFAWLIYGLSKLVQRNAARSSNHQPKIKKPCSKKWIAFVIFTLIVNSWNAYMGFRLYGIYQQIMTQEKNQDKRSRFILSRDFQYDQFLFPKGTLINLYNVHDSGKKFELPLSLYGLEKAKFPIPVFMAGVWTDTIDLNSDFNIFLQLSKDQQIAPLYKQDGKGGYVKDKQRYQVSCQQGQLAKFTVTDGYYPTPDYDKEDWYADQTPLFKPAQWLFVGCQSAPPIVLDPPYPQPKLNNDE